MQKINRCEVISFIKKIEVKNIFYELFTSVVEQDIIPILPSAINQN